VRAARSRSESPLARRCARSSTPRVSSAVFSPLLTTTSSRAARRLAPAGWQRPALTYNPRLLSSQEMNSGLPAADETAAFSRHASRLLPQLRRARHALRRGVLALRSRSRPKTVAAASVGVTATLGSVPGPVAACADRSESRGSASDGAVSKPPACSAVAAVDPQDRPVDSSSSSAARWAIRSSSLTRRHTVERREPSRRTRPDVSSSRNNLSVLS